MERALMNRTRVKFCGVCSAEDAAAAARLGADAIGMVFHPPSPRNVSLESAEKIMAAIPAFVTPVGLFVDAPLDDIAQICRRLRLTYLQLHGHETPETAARIIDQTGASLLKAVRVDRGTLPAELDGWHAAIRRLGLDRLRGFVLETAAGPAPGGTGLANDWDAVRSFQEAGAFDRLPPIIAAGGLAPHNVADVVRMLRPFAVDVSSGVEAVRGQKSAEKMQAFVRAVRDADLTQG
jgi:phosphoribosylanthranilate isomerase